MLAFNSMFDRKEVEGINANHYTKNALNLLEVLAFISHSIRRQPNFPLSSGWAGQSGQPKSPLRGRGRSAEVTTTATIP